MIALYEFGRLLEPCLLTSGVRSWSFQIFQSPAVEVRSFQYPLWEQVKANIPSRSSSAFWLCKLLACSCCDLHWQNGCVNAFEQMQGRIRTTMETSPKDPKGPEVFSKTRFPGFASVRVAKGSLNCQWCVKNITKCMGMGHVTCLHCESCGECW